MNVTSVAISGASGFVGRHLLTELETRDDIARIVGIDLREPARRSPRLDFHRLDIASGELKPVLDDVDVIVHLAAIADPIPDETFMERVNVEGTRRVLEAASTARKVIRVSPTTTYGAWANNPVPLTEDAPIRPNPGFTPATHAAEVERILHDWGDEHPATSVAVFRAAPIVGSTAERMSTRLLLGRPPLRARGAAPPVQALHVDDLVRALVMAITSDLSGTYNVAPDGWITAEQAAELVGRTVVPALPAEVLERALTRAWTSGVGDVPPGVVPYLVHPWVVANDRLRATGWTPEYTNEEALVVGLEAVEPSEESKRVLALAIGGAAAVALGVGVGWLLRRRRG